MRLGVTAILRAETLEQFRQAAWPLRVEIFEHVDSRRRLHHQGAVQPAHQIDNRDLHSLAGPQKPGDLAALGFRQNVENGQRTNGKGGVIQV
jgi:hypothetical protein